MKDFDYTVTRMEDGSWVIDPEPPAEDRQAIIDACIQEESRRNIFEAQR